MDDALGEEVRVTVVAAGFDKVAPSRGGHQPFESRLSRLLEEPVRTGEPDDRCRRSWPRTTDDDGRVHDRSDPEHETVSFDAEEDLDIPDFLKS